MNDKVLPNRLEELQRIAIRKTRKCTYKQCGKDTVKNHCVPQSLLSNVTAGRHVRELAVTPWLPGMLIYNKRGIGEATIFQELCNYHDHTIFAPVDSPEPELTYDNLLRMTYRALLRERFKKTVKTESYGKFAQEFYNVRNQGVRESYLKQIQFQFNFQSISWYEMALISEMDHPADNFVFEVLEFPFFPVMGSELFTYELDEVTNYKRAIYQRTKVLDPFSDIFINLIPSVEEQKLKVTIGAHQKDVFLLRLLCARLRKKSTLKVLSDILFLHVEDWVCTEEFFQEYLHGNEQKLVSIFAATGGRGVISRSTKFNFLRKVGR